MKNQTNKERKSKSRFLKDLRWIFIPPVFFCFGNLAPLQAVSFNRVASVEITKSAEAMTILLQQAIDRGIAAEPHQVLYPLPQEQIDNNPNLEQNPGY